MSKEQAPVPVEEGEEQNITAESLCIINGVFIGSATVLCLNNQLTSETDKVLEQNTINYLVSYIGKMMVQGLDKEALAFLFGQMETAHLADPSNTIQKVALYLGQSVLEALQNTAGIVEKQS